MRCCYGHEGAGAMDEGTKEGAKVGGRTSNGSSW